MTKTSKSERRWGKDIDKDPPKKRNSKREVGVKEPEELYKILVDNSGFSKAMTFEECNRVMDEMELKATKLRRPIPNLMLVKQ